jgi:hypothetical protein
VIEQIQTGGRSTWQRPKEENSEVKIEWLSLDRGTAGGYFFHFIFDGKRAWKNISSCPFFLLF